MSFGLFCAGKKTFVEISIGFLYGIGFCVLALLAFRWWSNRIVKGLEGVKVSPREITRKREGLSGYFLAYVLPLILTEPTEKWLLWVVIALLAFSCFKTKSLGYNPIAELIGYNFYEVRDAAGIALLVASKKSPQELLQGFKGVSLTDDYLIEKQ